jgi:hypothetical protein
MGKLFPSPALIASIAAEYLGPHHDGFFPSGLQSYNVTDILRTITR